MGPDGIADAALAVARSSALREWGSLVGRAVDDLEPASRLLRPGALDDAAGLLRPVPSDAVRATGWELRSAFVWRNDNYCVQRAAFGALSLGEQMDGSIPAAVRAAATSDAAAAGMVVAYAPSRFPNGARMHAAMVARTTDDQLLVVDHLVSRADDGVMPLTDWMRTIGAKSDRTTILPALNEPTTTLGAPSGVPQMSSRWDGSGWQDLAGHLAGSWSDAARHQRPLAQQVGG